MARKPKRKFATAKDLENIDRFAGSSEEEDNPTIDDEETDSDQEADDTSSKHDDDDERKPSVDETDSDDDDPVVVNGMASVMNRILASRPAGGSQQTAVLSKTKTKLQIQAAKEEKEQKELRDRKRSNREKKLAAMHIPLTGDAITKEVEMEREHKRIATKGIVALFNAIAKHQQPKDSSGVEEPESSKGTKSKDEKLTKDGFLDMIKKQAAVDNVSAATTSNRTAAARVTTHEKSPSKWGALRDDFLLDGKKNWDEESSEDEAHGFKEPTASDEVTN